MYIMCFNVSICFKKGSLYSYYDIITKLVYPPKLSRIAGFCTNSNKIFLGRTPDPPFKQNCLRLYYNHNTANHLKKFITHTNIPPPFFWRTPDQMVFVCLIWKVHCWSFFREWMFERAKKSPWKPLEKNVPQKSLKKVCHDLSEPCIAVSSGALLVNFVRKLCHNTAAGEAEAEERFPEWQECRGEERDEETCQGFQTASYWGHSIG